MKIKIKKQQLNESVLLGQITNPNNVIGPIDFFDWFQHYSDNKKFEQCDLWKHIRPEMFDEIRIRFDLSEFKVLVGNNQCTKYNFDTILKSATSCHGSRGIARENYYSYFNCSTKVINDKVVPYWIYSRWGTIDRSITNWTFFYKDDDILEEILNV